MREMQGKALLLLLLVAGISAREGGRTTRNPTVEIPNGRVIGTQLTVDGKNISQFLAIPFAKPPVGNLRFRKPEPLTEKWTTPLVADKIPNGCLQSPLNVAHFPDDLLPSYKEDCLYLNVWTPAVKSENCSKSVMVWIHGGGFSVGESMPYYPGQVLASNGDVVVVTIQYRVGFMGFARFDDELVPGNNGLFDQQLALKWVHDNIAQFGGDPRSVTLFGQSAGSASVSYHLANKQSGKYFERAIMQSGAFGETLWTFNGDTEALEEVNRRLAAEYVNCSQVDTAALLKCLEGKTEDELRNLIVNLTLKTNGNSIIGPTIDGEFLSKAPLDLLASGDINKKDVLIGVTESEGTYFVNAFAENIMMLFNISGPVQDFVTTQFVRDTLYIILEYYPSYPERPTDDQMEMIISDSRSFAFPNRHNFTAVALADTIGMFMIDCAVYKFVDGYQALHENVYFYEMAHLPSQLIPSVQRASWMRASHGDDVPFIFLWPKVYQFRHMTSEEELLAGRMIDDWVHFAKTGEPSDSKWKRFTAEKKEFLQYKLETSTLIENDGLRRDRCAFWQHVLPLIHSS